MIGDWQTIAALLCVALAVAVLSRRAWRWFRGRSAGCGSGGCGTCPSHTAAPDGPGTKPFVSLDALHPPRSGDAKS